MCVRACHSSSTNMQTVFFVAKRNFFLYNVPKIELKLIIELNELHAIITVTDMTFSFYFIQSHSFIIIHSFIILSYQTNQTTSKIIVNAI